MKLLFTFLFVLSLLCGSSALVVAQEGASPQTDGDAQQSSPPAARDYGALIQEVFAPVTDELNLTKEQEFQIIAIITSTEAKSDPLAQKLDDVGQRLVDATLVDSPDEAAINRLSAQEALLLTQIIAMKTRAKASIYQVLTANQRTLVLHQFRGKNQLDATLGAIGIY